MRKVLHLKVMGQSLLVAVSLNHLHWTTRTLHQALSLISLQKNSNLNLNYQNKTKNRRPRSVRLQRTINVGVQSLYHGVFTTFQHHNALSYNYEGKALIISLLTNCKLVKTP
jgi:hypothetical protein